MAGLCVPRFVPRIKAFRAINVVGGVQGSHRVTPRNPERPPAPVLFDAYGTRRFDVYSVALAAEQLFPGHGEKLAVLWRDKQIEYTPRLDDERPYRPFWELTRAGLRFAAAAVGLALERSTEERLMNQYRHLSAFPENRGAARCAKRARRDHRHPLQRRPRDAGRGGEERRLQRPLDHVLSVHATRGQDRPGRLRDGALHALGPPPREILFVSATLGRHRATWYGFTTLGRTARRAASNSSTRAHAHRQQPARRA